MKIDWTRNGDSETAVVGAYRLSVWPSAGQCEWAVFWGETGQLTNRGCSYTAEEAREEAERAIKHEVQGKISLQ